MATTDAPLAGSRSPFLRHGAEQPVRWLPWGETAFERARREDKPVLLDIGAVWCHWCHVMDHESYEDPETAELINELFVPVKVDRDERPDVDSRYQLAIQAMTGQGGWPLTAFLTPEGETFFGGTYFPPDDRFGRPGFRRVLREVARVWREERERAVGAAGELAERLQQLEQAESQSGTLARDGVDAAIDALADAFDFRHGGFGRAPKFPNAGAVDLALDRYLDEGRDWARRMAVETLDAMARGGIQDQIGGGFHRYATDARWLVPHFEKMAYDNGVLLASYARAYAALGEAYYREIAAGIVEHYRDVAPALVDAGGFPASQDADVGSDDDGAYWTWDRDELTDALGGEERLVRAAVLRYGLEDTAATLHSDPSRHVLYLAATVEEVADALAMEAAEARDLLDEIRVRLKAARDRRPRPYVDETVYTGWTALVAAGHLSAGRYLGLDEAAVSGLRAMDRVWREGYAEETGTARRLADPSAGEYLEDQAYVSAAFLDAFELTQAPEWLERARSVLAVTERRFRDPGGDGYLDRPTDASAPARVLERPHRPIADAPSPGANAVMALNLLRLAALGGGDEHRSRAEAVLAAFAGSAERMPMATATYARALDWATGPVTTVAVVGEDGDSAADALLGAALSTYRPRTVVRRFAPGEAPLETLPPELAAMVGGEAPRAYLCAGRTCAAPVSEPEALAELLRGFRG